MEPSALNPEGLVIESRDLLGPARLSQTDFNDGNALFAIETPPAEAHRFPTLTRGPRVPAFRANAERNLAGFWRSFSAMIGAKLGK